MAFSSLQDQGKRDAPTENDGDGHDVVGHDGQQGEHAQAGHQGEMNGARQGRPAQAQPDHMQQHQV